MSVHIDCDLNGAVAHLFLHISKRSAVLNQQAAKRVPQVVEADFAQSGLLKRRQRVIVNRLSGSSTVPAPERNTSSSVTEARPSV